MIVSIHQPNFFPSYAFFQKIEQSDVFVILSNCQYEKGGYQNRFNIGENWYTMPVLNNGFESIKEKKYLLPQSNFQSLARKLPLYEKYMIEEFYALISDSLFNTNTEIIYKICSKLNIDRDKICFDFKTKLTGSERLLEICKHYGASTYISGSSGKKYLNEHLFEKENIEIQYQTNQDYTPILKKLKSL